MKEEIDIIIPCLKEPERLRRVGKLVEMIFENTELEFSIIIAVSKGSSAHNKNRGLDRARGSHVCFLDDDIIIRQRGWLSLMLETLRSQPKTGAVMPRLTFPNGGEQNLTSNIFDVRESKASCSACLLCRNGIARFDENFLGAWAEDEDFLLQLEQKGYKIYCDGRVSILHLAQSNSPLEANEVYITRKWKGKRR